jgi:hypothetical protein
VVRQGTKWTGLQITHLNLSKVLKLIYDSYDFVIHEKKIMASIC